MKFIGKLRGRERFHSRLLARMQSLRHQRGTSVTTDDPPLPHHHPGSMVDTGVHPWCAFCGFGQTRMIGILHHGIVLTSVAALRFLCPRGPFLVWFLGAYEDERRGGVRKTDSPQVQMSSVGPPWAYAVLSPCPSAPGSCLV